MEVSTLHIGSSNKLSPYTRLCLYSFARRGYSVKLYAYTRDLEIPDFVRLQDADKVVPAGRVFENAGRKAAGSFAMFSNLFRYTLLTKNETIWVDSDVILLGERLPEMPVLYGWEDEERTHINGAILSLPRASGILSTLLSECSGAPETLIWGQWGPKLITRVARELDLDGEALPASRLYPVGWRDALAPFAPGCCAAVQAATCDSDTIHLWNEVLRRHLPTYPEIGPASGSFLASLVENWGQTDLFDQSMKEEDLAVANRRLLESHPGAAARRKFPL